MGQYRSEPLINKVVQNMTLFLYFLDSAKIDFDLNIYFVYVRFDSVN